MHFLWKNKKEYKMSYYNKNKKKKKPVIFIKHKKQSNTKFLTTYLYLFQFFFKALLLGLFFIISIFLYQSICYLKNDLYLKPSISKKKKK